MAVWRGIKLQVFIWDDAGTSSLFFCPQVSMKYFKYNRFPENHGKERFWQVIDQTFISAREVSWDYFLLLQDDLELTHDFFDKVLKAWGAIDDERAVINLFTDDFRKGRPVWGCEQPIVVEYPADEVKLWKCNWTDPMFFCARPALEVLEYEMRPITQHRDDLGSRVGQQLTKRWGEASIPIYQGYETFTHHGDHESMMNPELRRRRPLVA